MRSVWPVGMADAVAVMIASGDETRLWSALSFACSSAALGKSVALFFSGAAAALMRHDRVWTVDSNYVAAGVPSMTELFSTAVEMGITFSICQTGMAMCTISLAELRPGGAPAGLIGWLSAHGDADLTIF